MLLNLDAGESPAESPEQWALADILCVACGGHAGDTSSMERVVRFCADRRRAGLPAPRLGAHPSYPDRANFGRISRLPSTDYERQSLFNDLTRQVTELIGIGAQWNVQVEFIKPHGALYHDANANAPLARICQSGLVKVNRPDEEVQAAMDEAALREIPRIAKRTGYLALLANLAMLTGLLGTVSGLITSFGAVSGESVDPSQKARILAEGISEAMNCTAFGLIVALIALIGYAVLNGKTQQIEDDINEASVQVLNLVVTNRQKVNLSAVAA